MNAAKLLAVFAAAFVLSGGSYAAGQERAEFSLVEDGRPAAAFLVPPGQSADISCWRLRTGEQAAGVVSRNIIDDFNEDLRESAGCELPVVETDCGERNIIRFNVEERLLPDQDRFSITFPDERTMLITSSALGIRWALNHVLEEFAGVRYLGLSKNATHFPGVTDLKIPGVTVEDEPSFNIYRQVGWHGGNYWPNRMNALNYRVRFNHDLTDHAFPVERYMEDDSWPDFIFPVIAGERFLPYKDRHFREPFDYRKYWQPCLTDERVVEEAVRNIILYFDENPGKFSISLGVNDIGGFCHCEGCRELIGEERTITGHTDFSKPYYLWVNRVVEGVTEVYPDKYFGLLAYRETTTPPDFDLHENVVPFLCFDIQSCMDPEVRKKWLDILEEWGERTPNLAQWEYGRGADRFYIPRVYYGLQKEIMRLAYERGLRGMYVQTSTGMEEGPKRYLYHKLLWNIDLDLEETLREWYEAAVGAEAAPYLQEYYSLWEAVWEEKAVKTDWFQRSKHNVYLSTGDLSYLYAPDEEDMLELRRLMERVSELAARHGDERQRIRAGWLKREFEYSEACVYAAGGHIFPPSGNPETPGQATAYLEYLGEAIRYDAIKKELYRERRADPEIAKGGLRSPPAPAVPGALSRIAPMAGHPEVARAFRDVLERDDIPPGTRALVDVVTRLETGDEVNNLLKDGRFDDGGLDGWSGGRIVSEKAFRSKNAMRVDLSSPRSVFASRHHRNHPTRVEPGQYLASAMIYIDTNHFDVEQHVQMTTTGQREGRNREHWRTPTAQIHPGEWTRLSVVADIRPSMDSFGIDWIIFTNYEEGDVAYIDDIAIVPLNQE